MILDEQHRGVNELLPGALNDWCKSRHCRDWADRHQNREGRAAAGRARNRDTAVRLLNKSVDLAQSEAGSFIRRLGREERLKDPVADGIWYADARIGKLDEGHVLSQFLSLDRCRKRARADRDADATAIGHRIA